jgi:hypothetical protein
MSNPSKEYMRAWRRRNKERIRTQQRGRTRHDAKEIKGLPRVSEIGGLTLKDWIG